MTSISTDVLLNGLKQYFTEVPDYAKLLEDIKTGGLIHRLGAAIALLELTITLVEKLAGDLDEVCDGGTKKQALVKFLDDAIKLNILFEQFDGPLISAAIDKFVLFRNWLYGHNWLEKFRVFIR